MKQQERLTDHGMFLLFQGYARDASMDARGIAICGSRRSGDARYCIPVRSGRLLQGPIRIILLITPISISRDMQREQRVSLPEPKSALTPLSSPK
jgi:hypothetical protein